MEYSNQRIINAQIVAENCWRVQGSCVAQNGRATLFIGPPGSGKSRLVAEAIHLASAQLVADDQLLLTLRDGVLYASPVPNIAGVLAVREHGLLRLNMVENILLANVIATVPLPDLHDKICLFGVNLPLICLSNAQVAPMVVEAFFRQADANGNILPEDWLPNVA